jgi:hypothetical protein
VHPAKFEVPPRRRSLGIREFSTVDYALPVQEFLVLCSPILDRLRQIGSEPGLAFPGAMLTSTVASGSWWPHDGTAGTVRLGWKFHVCWKLNVSEAVLLQHFVTLRDAVKLHDVY